MHDPKNPCDPRNQDPDVDTALSVLLDSASTYTEARIVRDEIARLRAERDTWRDAGRALIPSGPPSSEQVEDADYALTTASRLAVDTTTRVAIDSLRRHEPPGSQPPSVEIPAREPRGPAR